MATTLLSIGPSNVINQNQVYALPARICQVTTSASCEVSVDGVVWSALTSGSTTGATFIRCTSTNPTVTCKAVVPSSGGGGGELPTDPTFNSVTVTGLVNAGRITVADGTDSLPSIGHAAHVNTGINFRSNVTRLQSDNIAAAVVMGAALAVRDFLGLYTGFGDSQGDCKITRTAASKLSSDSTLNLPQGNLTNLALTFGATDAGMYGGGGTGTRINIVSAGAIKLSADPAGHTNVWGKLGFGSSSGSGTVDCFIERTAVDKLKCDATLDLPPGTAALPSLTFGQAASGWHAQGAGSTPTLVVNTVTMFKADGDGPRAVGKMICGAGLAFANGLAFPDTDIARNAANSLVTTGTLDVGAMKVTGTAGVDFGPALLNTLTTKKGIVSGAT